MDKVLVLLVGPQGAGKTTWCEQNLPGFLRISQDDQGPREHLRLFEEAVARSEPRLVIDRTSHIDTQAWSPLVYNFRHYFGLGQRLGRARRAEY